MADNRGAGGASYDPAWFAPLAAVEDRHFWFRARNRVIRALAGGLTAGLAPGYWILEVGCGTGSLLPVLAEACPGGVVVGADLFGESLTFARRRARCPVVAADIGSLPFRPGFALIGLFDVLEHLEDDVAVLGSLRRLLAPEGALLLTVPAHPSLWSYFDEAARHRRRYEAGELEQKLARAGYRIEYLTPFMSSIFPLLWLGRRLAPRLGRRSASELVHQELRVTPVLNELLGWMLAPEAAFIARRRRLPVGTSLAAVARPA